MLLHTSSKNCDQIHTITEWVARLLFSYDTIPRDRDTLYHL